MRSPLVALESGLRFGVIYLALMLPMLSWANSPKKDDELGLESQMLVQRVEQLKIEFQSLKAESLPSTPMSSSDRPIQKVASSLLSQLKAELSRAFFFRLSGNSDEISLEYDDFMLPRSNLSKVEVEIIRLGFEKQKSAKFSAKTKEFSNDGRLGFRAEIPEKFWMKRGKSTQEPSQVEGTFEATYFDEFVQSSIPAKVGSEIRINGKSVRVQSVDKNFIQLHIDPSLELYAFYARDEKGIEIGSLAQMSAPMLPDGRFVWDLTKEDLLNAPPELPTGSALAINVTFNGTPAVVYLLHSQKTKKITGLFTAQRIPQNTAKKAPGTRYLNQSAPMPVEFSQEKILQLAALTLRRDSYPLAYFDEPYPYSNELILKLDGLSALLTKSASLAVSDLKILDAQNRSVPSQVRKKFFSSDSPSSITIQVPATDDSGNIDKKRLFLEKKPFYPDGKTLTAQFKVEIPLDFKVFEWPKRPLSDVEVKIKDNRVDFKMPKDLGIELEDFFVSDGSGRPLYILSKGGTPGPGQRNMMYPMGWTGGSAYYWGKPKKVTLRQPSKFLRYEGTLGFQVPPVITPDESKSHAFFGASESGVSLPLQNIKGLKSSVFTPE